MGSGVDAVLGVLNGAIGDYLHATGNGLAIDMSVVRGTPGRRTSIFLHGLMCTEEVWRMRDGSDYGALLERDLGIAPLYLRFNSGRGIVDNGEALSRLLDDLVASHPEIEELVPVGFSMGGLVFRSATHVASRTNSAWLSRVRDAFYLGTPHLGSPWERAGRALVRVLRGIDDPYTRLAAELGDLRSSGIKDLGDAEHPVPLLPSIQHHFIAGLFQATLLESFGDVMVPLASGTNGHCADARAAVPAHVKIMPGFAHMTLAHHPDVYAHLRAWCEGEESRSMP